MEGLAATFAGNPNVGSYKGTSKMVKASGPKKKKKKCKAKKPK